MAISYDDVLNGSQAAPAYKDTVATALPAAPKDGATDFAATAANMAGSRAILLVWFLVFAALVAAHVLTLSVQK